MKSLPCLLVASGMIFSVGFCATEVAAKSSVAKHHRAAKTTEKTAPQSDAKADAKTDAKVDAKVDAKTRAQNDTGNYTSGSIPGADDPIHKYHTPEQHAAWLRAAKRLNADTHDEEGSGPSLGGGGHHH